MSLRVVTTLLLVSLATPVPGPASGAPLNNQLCVQPDLLVPDATLDLKRAYLDNRQDWIGVFELVNYDIKRGFPIYLEREEGQAFASSLSTQVEFRNLYGFWTVLDDVRLPGTYVTDPKKVKVVKPGERLTFHYRLFPRGVLKYGGMEFQLTLYGERRGLCIVSFPFMSEPPPPPPTGVGPVPHPHPSTQRDTTSVLKKCHKSKVPPHSC